MLSLFVVNLKNRKEIIRNFHATLSTVAPRCYIIVFSSTFLCQKIRHSSFLLLGISLSQRVISFSQSIQISVESNLGIRSLLQNCSNCKQKIKGCFQKENKAIRLGKVGPRFSSCSPQSISVLITVSQRHALIRLNSGGVV